MMNGALDAITYTLRLTSDLHVGSGLGAPGLVDETVVRDSNDLAYVPFSEIKGVIRDAGARLASDLDLVGNPRYTCGWQAGRLRESDVPVSKDTTACREGDDAPCLFCCLFGSPAHPAWFWFSPAQYPDDYRELIGDLASFRGDGGRRGRRGPSFRGSGVTAHNAIDRDTRRASDDHLFFFEVVRRAPAGGSAGWPELRGEIRFRPPFAERSPGAPADADLEGWMVASLLSVRRMGKRRRRGYGSCRFVLPEERQTRLAKTVDSWLDELHKVGALVPETAS